MKVASSLIFEHPGALYAVLEPEFKDQVQRDPMTQVHFSSSTERLQIRIESDSIVAIRAVLNTILRLASVHEATLNALELHDR